MRHSPAVAEQAKRQEAIARARQEAADKLVELQGHARVSASVGPARYLATQLGTDAETVVRWLVALVVLLIDPSAVVLTIAASRRRLA